MSNKQQILDITDRTFDEEVLKKDNQVVLLLVWNEFGTRCKNANYELLDAIEHAYIPVRIFTPQNFS